MKKLDYLVVLGARIGVRSDDADKRMTLSEHMLLRAESAARFYNESADTRLIVAGGPSFCARYPLYLDQPLVKPPDFSEKAIKLASRLPSEAAVISLWLNAKGVPFDTMILEQRSRTTTENAIEVANIVNDLSGGTTGILSMVFHLNRPRENAMEVFRKEFAKHGLPEPTPVYTEAMLHRHDTGGFFENRLAKFYQTPYRGFLWSFDQIWSRLENNKDLAGLQPIRQVD